MPGRIRIEPTWLYLLLGVSATIIGLGVPTFYEWTDSDQSRPSSLLWQIPAGAAVIGLLFCCTLPWMPISRANYGSSADAKLQFGLKILLAATSAVGVLTAFLTIAPGATSYLVCGSSYLLFVYIVIRNRAIRLPAIALLLCMCGPFIWMLGPDGPRHIDPLLRLISIFGVMPGSFVSAILLSLFGFNAAQIVWPSALLTACGLSAGLTCISIGPRASIAWMLFCAIASTTGSIGIFQLTLM